MYLNALIYFSCSKYDIDMPKLKNILSSYKKTDNLPQVYPEVYFQKLFETINNSNLRVSSDPIQNTDTRDIAFNKLIDYYESIKPKKNNTKSSLKKEQAILQKKSNKIFPNTGFFLS